MTYIPFPWLGVAGASGASGGTAALGWSAPNGLSDDASITITTDGTYNFGSGPTIVLYDDFREQVDGATHSTSAQIGTWNAASGKVFVDANLPKSRGMRVVGVSGQLTSKVTFPLTSEYFFSALLYVPAGDKFPVASSVNAFPTTSDLKSFWALYGAGADSDSTEPDHVWVPYTGSKFYNVASNDSLGGLSTYDQSGNVGWGSLTNTPDPTWHNLLLIEGWCKGNGTSAGDGMFLAVPAGLGMIKKQYNSKAWFNTDHQSAGKMSIGQINMVGYVRSSASYSGPGSHNFVMSNVYVAAGSNACARVEIGDNAAYTSCTRLSLCTVSSWGASSITATLREGMMSSVSGSHLFYTDSTNTTRYVGALS